MKRLATQPTSQRTSRRVPRYAAAWLAAAGPGVALAFAYFNHFLRSQAHSRWDYTLTLSYLALLGTLLSYAGLARFVRPRLHSSSRRTLALRAVAALAAAALLLLAAPDKVPTTPTLRHLEVFATGTHNPAAQGSEVWLTGLYHPDGVPVAPAELALEPAWTLRDGAYLAVGDQAATLRWQAVVDGDVQLVFKSHPWSGVVQVRWDDQTQTIDLFAPTSGQRTINLPNVATITQPTTYTWLAVGGFVADFASVSFLLWLASILLIRRATLAAVAARASKQRSWLLALVGGAVLSFTYFNHALADQPLAPPWQTLRSAGFVVVWVILCYGLLGRARLPLRRTFARRRLVVWLVAAMLLAAVLVVWRTPARASLHPASLEIIATGQHNPASQASEVWVQGVYRADGSQVALADLTLEGAWLVRDGVPVSAQDQPATLRLPESLPGDLRVQFLSHDWSGIVEVRRGGQSQLVDLYSSAMTTRDVAVAAPSRAQAAWTTLYPLAALAADGLSLAAGLLVIGVWVATRREQAVRRRGHGAALAWLALLAVPLTPLLASAFLGGGHYDHQMSAIDYLAIWLYSLLLLGVGWYLFVYRPAAVPASVWAARPGWLGRMVVGQTLGAWLVALVAAGVIAGALVSQAGIGGAQRARWVKLAFDTARGTPPETLVRYGPNESDNVPVGLWQPYATADVAVRPLEGTTLPIRVSAITTDRGPLPLDQVTVVQGTTDPAGITIADPRGALLTLPQTSRAFTLTLAAGSGSVEVLRFDQRASASLGAGPVQASLQMPASIQGWALLPAQAIDQLAIEFPHADTSASLREVEVVSDEPQRWPDPTNGAGWAAQGCALQVQPSAVQVTAAGGARCRVQVPGVRALNSRNYGTLALGWAALTLLGLALLGALVGLARLEQRLSASFQPTERRFGRWLRVRSQGWSTGWLMLLVWVAALLVQSVYVFTMIIIYTNDSLDYYINGHFFAATFRFGSLVTTRTPGYLTLIGVVIALFGDTVRGLIIAQHLALTLLAPLTVWALVQRTPKVIALCAGVLVAGIPVMSVYANNIGTEPMFVACATAALLVYAARGATTRGVLVAGLLAGATTMVRPNGALLVVVLLGWMLLAGWCCIADRARQRLALYRCAALVVGYLAVAAPWHLHLKLVRDTYDLSQGLAGFTGWAAGVYQGRIDAALPVNRPERALWSADYVWSREPYFLLGRDPQMQHGISTDMQPYYAAAGQEERLVHPDRWRDNLLAAFIYNLAFVETNPRYLYWKEVSRLIILVEAGQPQPPAVPSDANEQLINPQVTSWQPPPSPLRAQALWSSKFVLSHWQWLAIPALFSVCVLLVLPVLRPFVPFWGFWMGLVVSTSALGMPVERYVAVAEPLLYVLIIMGLFGLIGWQYRRVDVLLSTS